MTNICMRLDKCTEELHKIFTELQLVFFNLFHELETEGKLSVNNFSKNRISQIQSSFPIAIIPISIYCGEI